MNQQTSTDLIFQHLNDGESHALTKLQSIVAGKTSRQSYEIARLKTCGISILIDGCIQSSQVDEVQYHEAMVVPALAFHSNVKRVLCVGGGTGGLLKQVLKIPELESVDMVDIDQELHEISKVYLPHMHEQTLADRRVRLHFGEPIKLLRQLNQDFDHYDLIIADLPDATSGCYAVGLFTLEFYQLIGDLLNHDGIYVTHAGQAHPRSCEFLARVFATMSNSFAELRPYTSFVPTFGTPWTFMLASPSRDLILPDRQQFDRRFSAELRKMIQTFDYETLTHMFHLPKPLRDGINAADPELISQENQALVSIAD